MRPTRGLLAALLVIGIAACGNDPETGTGGTAQQPADGTSTTTITDPEAPVGPPTLEDVGLGEPLDCDPWSPFHAVAGTYGGEPAVVGVARPDQGSIDVLARRHQAPDTDGDGAPDAVEHETGRVDVRRGDGTVSITRADGSVGVPGGQTWTGDLEGDGRDELVVYATHPQDLGILEVYLIPGTVPVGEHDPADVGILLPWQPNELVWSVGDHDGDGTDDILVSGDPDPIVVPGAQLLAPGAGGMLDAASLQPLRRAPRHLVGVLELSAGVPPVFVTATDTGGDPATRIELQVLTEPPLRLRIGGLEPIGGGWGASGSASGHVSDGERIVVYRFSGGRSGYDGEWHWNLDLPCQAV